MSQKQCSYCDSSFSKVEHLRRHERSHTGEKPFQCQRCLKRFSRGDVLNRHYKRHLDSGKASSAAYSLPGSGFSSLPVFADQDRGPATGAPIPPNAPTSGHVHDSSFPGTNLLDPSSDGLPQLVHRHGSMEIDPALMQSEESIQQAMFRNDGHSDPVFLSLGVGQTANQSHYHPNHDSLSASRANQYGDGPFISHQGAIPGTLALTERNNHDMHMYDSQPLDHSSSKIPHNSEANSNAPSYDFTNGRFDEMAKLWPRKGDPPWKLMDSLWTDVISHDEENIFSRSTNDESYPIDPRLWASDEDGIDEERRLSLIKEFGEQTDPKMKFPSADTLELSIDMYFNRFHNLLPLIHRPTFSIRQTPNLILFPICLMGYFLLDPKSTRDFTIVHLSKTVRKCIDVLSRRWSKAESVDLLTVLASGVVLLCCSGIIEERVNSEETYDLYCKVLAAAQQHALFEPAKGVPLDIENTQTVTDETSWKLWARVESTKRIIAGLIMVDGYFSYNMGTSPVIRADTLQFYAPCPASLFEAKSLASWNQLATGGFIEPPIIDLRPFRTILPTMLSSCEIAMHTLLSAVWLRLADLRYRLVLQSTSLKQKLLFPLEIYQEDPSSAVIVPLLCQIYNVYRNDLVYGNPNSLVFWHNINMNLTANIDLLEVATGRDGTEAARLALINVQTWAQSTCARRACLHAAQVFMHMSRRKVTDGTMFQSESAIVCAALVAGLYFYVEPETLHQNTGSGQSAEPFELLDDVDWSRIGEEGLCSGSQSSNSTSNPALNFITHGGPVSFHGKVHTGGYGSTRRIILEYVNLLEEVGKWTSSELCRVLRIMSDAQYNA